MNSTILKFGTLSFTPQKPILGFDISQKREITTVPSIGGHYLSGNERGPLQISIKGEVFMSPSLLFETLEGIKGEHNLISSGGKNYGKFVLESFSIDFRTFFKDGFPKIQSFNLKLIQA